MNIQTRDFFRRRRDAYLADPLFHENEVQANKMMWLVLLISGIVLAAVWIASKVRLFELAKDLVTPAVVQGLVEIALLCITGKAVKNDAWWLRYLLLVGTTIVFARIDMMLTHKASLLMVFPVICSCRYFSRRLTIGMAVLTTVMFALSAAYGATHGLLNLNDLTLPVGTTMTTTGKWIDSAVEQVGFDAAQFTRNAMVYSYLPKWMIFVVVAVISTKIAHRGREMVLDQKALTQKGARIETELDLATRIQASMLPSVFPPFPNRSEFDLYAAADPAKEVGGDFYDFFLIDDDHLGLVMADVSGKGIPAALFMMACKIIIANNAMMGKSPARVLTDTNNAFCSSNPEQMFVTVWFGVLEISTGRITAANAGHEYPALKRAGGEFALLKDRHGFVIGGMADIPYTEYELQLAPGDKLFLYTDGVVEAMDGRGELFGAGRMLAALNDCGETSPEAVLESVRRAVDGFVGDAEQFDDLTMMCLDYLGARSQGGDAQ